MKTVDELAEEHANLWVNKYGNDVRMPSVSYHAIRMCGNSSFKAGHAAASTELNDLAKEHGDYAKRVEAELEKLRAENDEMKSVLGFYGNVNHWGWTMEEQDTYDQFIPEEDLSTEVKVTRRYAGKRARELLARIEGKK